MDQGFKAGISFDKLDVLADFSGYPQVVNIVWKRFNKNVDLIKVLNIL